MSIFLTTSARIIYVDVTNSNHNVCLNQFHFASVSQKEFMPYWNLSVTVLQGKFNQSYDVCEYISPQKHCDLWWNTKKLWFAAYYCTYSTWQAFVCTNFALSLVTKCDCYVILKLPTACACCHRTKTVNNSNAPKWNETFHFRVHSGVKVKNSVSDCCKETLINKSLTFKGFLNWKGVLQLALPT